MEFYKVKELPASQGNCAKSYTTPLSNQHRSSCSFMFSDPQQMDCCGMKNFKFKISCIERVKNMVICNGLCALPPTHYFSFVCSFESRT